MAAAAAARGAAHSDGKELPDSCPGASPAPPATPGDRPDTHRLDHLVSSAPGSPNSCPCSARACPASLPLADRISSRAGALCHRLDARSRSRGRLCGGTKTRARDRSTERVCRAQTPELPSHAVCAGVRSPPRPSRSACAAAAAVLTHWRPTTRRTRRDSRTRWRRSAATRPLRSRLAAVLHLDRAPPRPRRSFAAPDETEAEASSGIAHGAQTSRRPLELAPPALSLEPTLREQPCSRASAGSSERRGALHTAHAGDVRSTLAVGVAATRAGLRKAHRRQRDAPPTAARRLRAATRERAWACELAPSSRTHDRRARATCGTWPSNGCPLSVASQ